MSHTHSAAEKKQYVQVLTGWGALVFRTGDTGYLDADGWVYHVGRSKEMVDFARERTLKPKPNPKPEANPNADPEPNPEPDPNPDPDQVNRG